MEGTAHAITLIAVMAATVAALVFWSERPGSSRQVLWALLAGAGLFIGNAVFSTHLCHSGNAFSQYAIPALCLVLIRSFTRHAYPATRGIAWGIAITSVILTQSFTMLVHTDGYTGNPRGANRALRSVQQSNIERIENALMQHLADAPSNTTYSAGWLQDTPASANLDTYITVGQYEKLLTSKRAVVKPL